MFIQKLLKGIYITKKYVLCKVQGILYYNLKNLQGGTINTVKEKENFRRNIYGFK